MVRAELELGISRFQVRHPGHWATLPPNHAEKEIISVEGIECPWGGEKIKKIDPYSDYKYLGILETDDTKDTEMKETLRTECTR